MVTWGRTRGQVLLATLRGGWVVVVEVIVELSRKELHMAEADPREVGWGPMGGGESHPVIHVHRQQRVVVAVARHGEFGLHASLRSPDGGIIIPPVDQLGPFWERWAGC